MGARVRIAAHLLIWTLLAVAGIQGRTEEDDVEEAELYSTEATTEASTERSSNKRLVNIESLQQNCEIKSGLARCSGFNFEEPEEVAFFELPTQVRIAPDGATYELGEKQPLGTLIMENSTFVNFPLHLFYELPLLSELDMRQCRMQYVSWECFLAADKLKILLLSGNAITELSERSFSYASELEFLFLNDNKLSRLHPDAFKGLRELRHLDLSGNQIEELPERLFEDLAALHQLTIAENRLRFISNELLAQNSRLQTIILQGNQLSQLGEYAFSSAPHLLVLDVSHNAPLEMVVLNLNAGRLIARNCSLIRVNIFGAVSNVDLGDNQVQELYFSAPEALEDLVLRNNSLVQLATLSRVPRLRRLNVANNPLLRELPSDWQNTQLDRLDLSNTGLEQLPEAVLRGMPQLRKLNVSVNNISDIDPQDFRHLSQLTHFFIHGNNWNCFNLKMVMDMLILAHGITYIPDRVDADFPGSYINGIACMYRLPEREQLQANLKPELADAPSSSSAASMEYAQYSQPTEVEKLRKEFKAVVQHMESKFDMVFSQLNNLNAKMMSLENMNSSLWNQLTITV
ncbi:insulin-like growth factor-binding protein complex acid labile subunit [Drosophila novamexicana]|uniref:insulin-like growth factor-binding protein complex acid labile subunit n=1 Tax=Drosophila novamexicana TaxID=47314 RepID=UPI0011E5F6E0|nr:insulin-like growth factor-binding protein complex acid labile subunit [Drosophila novamexicana]